MADNPIVWRVKVKNVIYDIRSIIENQLGALATKNKATLTSASDVEGTLPVANGGTGITSNPSALVNLAETSADTLFKAAPRPGVTGTLPTGNGGTGITSNPSMLINLESTSAASVFASAPRPGVTGVLPVARGGTGNANGNISGNAATATKLASAKTVQTNLGSTSAASFDGSANITPGVTGTLPVANGGTGATSASAARNNLGVVQTTYDTFSGTTLTAENNVEYNASTALASLTIVCPALARGVIFGVNFTSSSSFSGVTFKRVSGSSTIDLSPKLSGDSLSIKSKRYNLIIWYDGTNYWCAAKAS